MNKQKIYIYFFALLFPYFQEKQRKKKQLQNNCWKNKNVIVRQKINMLFK